MAITLRTPYTGGLNGSSTTVAAAIATTSVAGDGLIVWTWATGAQSSPPTITDDLGNSYTQLATFNDPTDNATAACHYCKNSVGSSPTVTATYGTARTLHGICVQPITGHDNTATPACAGQNQSAPGTTTDIVTSGNVTPSAQPGKLIGFSCNSFGNAISVGTGFADGGGAFASWTSGAGGSSTRVESKSYAALSAISATFTIANGTGRSGSFSLAVPDAALALRQRGSVIAMLMAGIFSMGATASPSPAPGPAPGSGTATIVWEVPSTDGDGAPLTDLNAYKVLWGTDRGVYTFNSGLLSLSTLTYTATGLYPATWYFAVVAIDAVGNESNFGLEVSKVIT